MRTETYDCIVAGVGGMGSAALYHLAGRGLRVLGLEQFTVGHARGSSHGETRLIRKAYFEHPDYVPLLHRAYALWDQLAAEAQQPLFDRCGLLLLGDPQGEVVTGVRRAAAQHQLAIEDVDAQALAARFPSFVPPPGAVGLYEADAGSLQVEDCVRAHAALAQRRGAVLRERAAIHRVRALDGAVEVETTAGRFSAAALVVCGGPFAPSLLRGLELSLPLRVQRQALLWFDAQDQALRRDAGCPAFGVDTPAGFFYGFPVVEGRGLKLAHHGGGAIVAHPDVAERGLLPGDEAPVRAFLQRHLPAGDAPLLRHEVCFYTMTPDEHFIIDSHPLHPQVSFAAGFSGHGFKFCSVVGEILADLATDGRTAHPIGFLRAGRPALAAPGPSPLQ